jgi:hypothetical protein
MTILGSLTHTSEAQYFGRNKVRYHSFPFDVLETEHFSLYFYDQEREAAIDAARMAERWYDRYRKEFAHQYVDRKPIILYANQSDFAETNVIGGLLGEATGGVTEPLRDRVVLPFTGVYGETDHVIGHELVHVFQFDIAQNPSDTLSIKLDQLPTWFIEGMAEYLSLGREDPLTAMWMRDAALRDDFPSIKEMGRNPRFFPYRFGEAFWAFVGGTWGDEAVRDLYDSAGHDGLDKGIRNVLGVSTDSLSSMWKRASIEFYTPLSKGKTLPGDSGDPVLSGKTGAGEMNLAPSISPDGEYVAYLSDEGLFSIDLYLADAHTGKILRRLTSTATNPHFDALRFVDSAGSWSPDGARFAFVATREGLNVIAILDVASRTVEKEIRVPGAGGLSNPAWSPDGRFLVISGNAGGLSDLYRISLADGAVTRLTGDKYAQLQPTWSPDGKTIAYVTDEGPGTDLQGLSYGNYRIGFYDVATGARRTIAPFEGAKNINPQYSPDGEEIYFIADPDGFSDVYRLHLATGEIYRVTQVRTGVSGITSLAPAMSVARRTGRMLFSVFEKNSYMICGRDAAGLHGDLASISNRDAAFLPPAHPGGVPIVSRYLAAPSVGLPPAGAFAERAYHPSMRLLTAGASGAGVSFDRFGATIGGGIGLFFSDMLENRELGVEAAVNGSLKDFGGEVSYQNNRTRWTWGMVAGHVPLLSVASGIAAAGDTLIYQQLRERQYSDGATLLAQYPFSSTRRIEMGVGYTRISFNTEIETMKSLGDLVFSDETSTLPSAPGLNLFQPYVAYVADNSFFGYTSPIMGRRYRIEVDPTIGSLRWESLLADYRRYYFFKPVTVAWRALHYGRYGSDSDSPSLTPLFLGYETLVRGYSEGSFTSDECASSGAACPVFDRLVGSRVAVASLEVRVPVVGSRDLGLIHFPLVPIELAGFADGGVAWSKGDPPVFRFARDTDQRVPVFSAGLTTRVNVLGAVVVEVFYVYPFQRPGKGGMFGYQIAPGW